MSIPLVVLGVLASLLVAATGSRDAGAIVVPTGFRDRAVLTGLDMPTVARFAPDGRVFVAEKSGVIKVFDGLGDTTATVFADLRTEVHNFWDRGLLGLAVDPAWPQRPYVYALYTRDAVPGGNAPRWGQPGATSDGCADPTGVGCLVSGRLVRLTASGDRASGSTVLVDDWCQQFPSHSVGSLAFGPDGSLYASGGDGASFNYTDYGQTGNPCGDPPTPGSSLTSPTGEGGALRSQDLRTAGDPVGLAGTVIRIHPDTGAGVAGNPFAGSADANARRIIASGLRNPFRFAMRPGTSEAWVGDVGWGSSEEVNRIASVQDATAENFGWPCYEATSRTGYSSLNVCSSLYAAASGAHRVPYFSYQHSAAVVTGDNCGSGSSAIAGVAFRGAGSYPAAYDGAMFFADNARGCIWAMQRGANGQPDPATRHVVVRAVSPVDLVTGPGEDLFYVDIAGGALHRLEYAGNTVPTAAVIASPSEGPAPLTVTYDATGSRDANGDPLTYTWDLDGNGTFGDATGATATTTYTQPGAVTASVRATDSKGASDTASTTVRVLGGAPTPVIDTPAGGLRWRVGEQITFSGSASDPQDGALPASALTWSLVQQHCPSNCHSHPVTTWERVSSGTFTAPDHEYPSHLELRLTATDSTGNTATTSVELQPQTVAVTLQTVPAGLPVTLNGVRGTSPQTGAVIVGSRNTVSAPATTTTGGTTYTFSSWSDGGPATHDVTVSDTPVTLTATYTGSGPQCAAGYWFAEYFPNRLLSGTPVTTRCEAGIQKSWGTGAPPNTGVSADNFSVRWTKAAAFAGGPVRFTMTVDSGMRLLLDDVLTLNKWAEQAGATTTATRTVEAGQHALRVEYVERTGTATAKFSYAG